MRAPPSRRISMRPPKPFPAGSGEPLQRLLKQAKTVADQRRIQAVLMRALDASTPEHIATVTGLSVATVRILHSRFLRERVACLKDRPGRGGRRKTLAVGSPGDRLAGETRSGRGRRPDGGGRSVPAGLRGACRASGGGLHGLSAAGKAGWRKVVPRPSHPKRDPATEAAFKKSSRKS